MRNDYIGFAKWRGVWTLRPDVLLRQAFAMGEASVVPGAREPPGALDLGRRRRRLACIVPLMALLALLAIAAATAAHHSNPACAGGALNQTWENVSGGDFELSGQFEYWNDCILIRSNVTLTENTTVRLHDVRVAFDNDNGSYTIHLGNATVWEMTDFDRNQATANDGSRLEIFNGANQTSGFVFDAQANSSVYINDTVILGGGFPGNGLTSLSGLYFADLMDFGWNRVDHTTFANGLLLINFTLPRVITNYSVVGAGNGVAVYLKGVGNLSFVNLTTRAIPSGVVIEESQTLGFRNLGMANSQTAFKATRVQNLSVINITDGTHRAIGMEFDRVFNLTLRSVRLAPPILNPSTYGIELDNSREIRIQDADVWNHQVADLHIINQTQDLLVLNATFQGPVNPPAGSRGIWAVVPGDVFNPNNFTFVNVTIANRDQGAALNGVVLVVFRNTTITGTITDGLETIGCANLRFANGTIQSSQGPGAHLDGSNLTIETTLIQQNQGSGVRLGDAGFTLDRVTFQFNSLGSVRSFGAVRLAPSAILSSALASANGADAVSITGSDLSSFTRLVVLNNTFQNLTAGGGTYALRLSTIGFIDVFNNTFSGLPVAVLSSGTYNTTGNTYRLQGLSQASVVILFDGGRELEVANESFVNPPLQPLSTVIRAPGLIAEAEIFNLRLPRADFGIWLSGVALDQSTASVVIDNVTLDAVRDGISSLGIRSVAISNVTVLRSRVAINVVGGGDAETLWVTNSTLQAAWTAIFLATDSGGQVTATDIALNLSAGPPGNATVVRGGAVVTLGRTTLDGVDFGFDILDARRVFLTQQNFTRNRFGLAMNTSGAITSTALNWTVDTDTVVRNSTLRLVGDVRVQGVALTIDNSLVSIYALPTEPNRFTRFFMEGPSRLILLNGTRILTEAANGSQVAESRFTVQMAATAHFSTASPAPWPHIILEGLGDPSAADPTEQGILLRAEDTAVRRVDFLNATRGLIADGVNITVTACNFSGMSGSGAAVTVIGRGTQWRSYVSDIHVSGMDGVNATSANVSVTQSSFSTAGTVLALWNAVGELSDAFVSQSSYVVWARLSSVAQVRSTNATSVGTAYIAEGSSFLEVFDSNTSRFQWLARASGAGSITFENPVVDSRRADDEGQAYPVQSPGGSVLVFWTARFAVCTLSDTLNATGASVEVTDQLGRPTFAGQTGASGFTADVRLLEFTSINNTETYFSPWLVVGTLGNLVGRLDLKSPVAPTLVLCVDDVPPVIVLGVLGPRGNRTRDTEFTLSGSAYDDHSGLKPRNPCVSFNEGECIFLGNPFDNVFVLPEGPITFRIDAEDLFGNRAVRWVNFTADRTAPSIVACSPDFTFVTRNQTVDLVCQATGEPTNGTISGLSSTAVTIDGSQRIYATVTLAEGATIFTLSLSDDLGVFASWTFTWKLDTQPPRITLNSPPPGITSQEVWALSGTVESDAAQLTFNGTAVAFPSFRFSVYWFLVDGPNEGTLVATDAVGNVASLPVTIIQDRTTNCSIATPAEGSTTGEGRITIGGTCDPDVTVTVGDAATVRPSSDHSWSVAFTLREGPNNIRIFGEDPNGATFEFELHVFYVRGGSSNDTTLLVLFGLLAGGTFALAFFISRRPRRDEFEEVPRSMTASQKAPPRPKPPTLKLPESPEDQAFKPRPPAPRPPPPPPPGR